MPASVLYDWTEMLFIEAQGLGLGHLLSDLLSHLAPIDSGKFGYQFNKFESPTILPTSD